VFRLENLVDQVANVIVIIGDQYLRIPFLEIDDGFFIEFHATSRLCGASHVFPEFLHLTPPT
jgi:hypothetical protein